MMDLFENEFVDMDSIVQTELKPIEEFRSPFTSPKKNKDRSKSPLRMGAQVSKEEYRASRKAEK
jgi:hypothetical protein